MTAMPDRRWLSGGCRWSSIALASGLSIELALAVIDAALSAFEVGGQADDTAVLAVERVGVRTTSGDRGPLAEHEGSG